MRRFPSTAASGPGGFPFLAPHPRPCHPLEVSRAPSDAEYEWYRRLAADQYRKVIRGHPGSREAEAARTAMVSPGFTREGGGAEHREDLHAVEHAVALSLPWGTCTASTWTSSVYAAPALSSGSARASPKLDQQYAGGGEGRDPNRTDLEHGNLLCI